MKREHRTEIRDMEKEHAEEVEKLTHELDAALEEVQMSQL